MLSCNIIKPLAIVSKYDQKTASLMQSQDKKIGFIKSSNSSVATAMFITCTVQEINNI